jgi:hypothetical protein
MMKSSASKVSRRNFLLAVGAGGVVTATVVAARKGSSGQAKKTEAVTGASGYRLTEHVRKYYDTTKV